MIEVYCSSEEIVVLNHDDYCPLLIVVYIDVCQYISACTLKVWLHVYYQSTLGLLIHHHCHHL